jgi:opacity protein-like surface antigen
MKGCIISTALCLLSYSTTYAACCSSYTDDYNANWFVAAEIGGQKVSGLSNQAFVANGSGYPSPYAFDLYTINNPSNKPIAGLKAGYRWALDSPVFDAVSLGLHYRHYFSAKITGQIQQYSYANFTNYNYTTDITANLLMLNAKLNFMGQDTLKPYIEAGAGFALINGNYSEVALANVTPRVSPAYGSPKTRGSLLLGIGLDYFLDDAWILSGGYEFTTFGTVNTGYGVSTWNAEKLSLGKYNSQALILGVSYLLDVG